MYYIIFYSYFIVHCSKSCIKAAAWAKPSQGQAVFGGFGLAWGLRKPKPARAKPKPGLLGQAGPEQH
jgi:hypothetical protein